VLEVAGAPGQQVLPGVAEHLAEPLVGLQDAPVDRPDADPDGGRGEHRGEPALAGPPGVLGLLPGGERGGDDLLLLVAGEVAQRVGVPGGDSGEDGTHPVGGQQSGQYPEAVLNRVDPDEVGLDQGRADLSRGRLVGRLGDQPPHLPAEEPDQLVVVHRDEAGVPDRGGPGVGDPLGIRPHRCSIRLHRGHPG
jgi:hypothetical protein